ncbi:MAG: tripartite tricarboxylate transporter substrate binding protein [Burkholderiales bacterium]|nr:tripartite tricarboxylate transporter substrate binding protein [Burkholderiales bacterium]
MSTFTKRREALTRIAGGALAAAMLARPLAGLAQAPFPGGWPNRPVRFVIPSGPGAQTDLFARYVADTLSKVFGQPFVPENRPGASGNIGAMAVVNAPADGYALLFSAASFTIVPAALNPDQPYDLLRDLAPIAQIGVGGLFLSVSPDMPVKSVKDLFDLAGANPGRYSYGTTGIGSTGHLIMASLLSQRGLRMTHVPYKSSAEVLRDMVGGILQVGWVDSTSSLGMVQAGKVRPLAHGATVRAPRTPDVPPLNDVGIPWNLDGWLGLFARAGTPEPIIRALNAEVTKLTQGEEGRARLHAMNAANPPPTTAAEFAQKIRIDLPQWRKIAVDNNIKTAS